MAEPSERFGSEPATIEVESTMKDDLCMDVDPPFRENAATAEDWRKALNKVVPAVVVLRTTACRSFDTEAASASYATGFVVDKRCGIILTNRHVVKPGPVVAEAMFVNREEVPVHPVYRDPVEPILARGDSVYLVGLSRSLQATSRKSIVTNPSTALNIASADCPRYRATNMEVIELDIDFGSSFSGVLTDEHGRVQAIWGSFSTQLKFGCNSSEDHQFVRGIPVYPISQVLDKIISGANGAPILINGIKRPKPLLRILEVELYPRLLSKAWSFGLSDDWVQALVKKDPIRRQVLLVKGCYAGSKAESLLEQGDMVLAIDKQPTHAFWILKKLARS